MKFYWKMPEGLQTNFKHELKMYYEFVLAQEYQRAWRQLERAHIIGQPWAVEHTYVHWLMLKFGIRIKNWQEIAGQLPRLIFGGVKSFVGKIPIGNTGGANVPPLQPMEIPDDIKNVMKPYLSNV